MGTNVNTETLKKQREREKAPAFSAFSAPDQLRMHLFDIEQTTTDANILAQAIHEELDGMPDMPGDYWAKINCFVTCIARNLQVVKESTEHALALTMAREGK
jgi:hypothetical protein